MSQIDFAYVPCLVAQWGRVPNYLLAHLKLPEHKVSTVIVTQIWIVCLFHFLRDRMMANQIFATAGQEYIVVVLVMLSVNFSGQIIKTWRKH